MSAASACSNDTSEITEKLVKINSTVTQTGFSEGPVHTAKKQGKHRKAIYTKEERESYSSKEKEKGESECGQAVDRVAKRIINKQKESQIFQLARANIIVMVSSALKTNYLSIFNKQVQKLIDSSINR